MHHHSTAVSMCVRVGGWVRVKLKTHLKMSLKQKQLHWSLCISHSHFISPPSGTDDSTISLFPEMVGVTQPFHVSPRRKWLRSHPPFPRTGVMQPFHFSPRRQVLHSHFHCFQDGRGYVAISLIPDMVGVTQPFHFSLPQDSMGYISRIPESAELRSCGLSLCMRVLCDIPHV